MNNSNMKVVTKLELSKEFDKTIRAKAVAIGEYGKHSADFEDRLQQLVAEVRKVCHRAYQLGLDQRGNNDE